MEKKPTHQGEPTQPEALNLPDKSRAIPLEESHVREELLPLILEKISEPESINLSEVTLSVCSTCCTPVRIQYKGEEADIDYDGLGSKYYVCVKKMPKAEEGEREKFCRPLRESKIVISHTFCEKCREQVNRENGENFPRESREYYRQNNPDIFQETRPRTISPP